VAFAPAEAEHFGIVPHKGDSLAWVGGPATEVACFDPAFHDNLSVICHPCTATPCSRRLNGKTYLILAVSNSQLRYRSGGWW